jgi:RNase P/RNase MRP subunit p29
MTPQGVKRIPKMHTRFQLHIGSRIVEIDGSVMALAPEKRINLHERKRIP